MTTTIIAGPAIRVTPAIALPLSIDEIKDHLRVLHATEDLLIYRYLQAATNALEEYTYLGLITQTWKQSWSAFPDLMTLCRRPVQAVTDVSYLDADNVNTVLDPGAYRVSSIGADKVPATVRSMHNSAWPATYTDAEAVTITYTVGFGDSLNSVPEVIKQAIKLMVTTFYEQRMDNDDVPTAARSLVRQWRPLAAA